MRIKVGYACQKRDIFILRFESTDYLRQQSRVQMNTGLALCY